MTNTFAKKSTKAFRQTILIITVFSGLLVFLAFKVSKNAYLYASVLIHKLTADCNCTQMTQLLTMHPYIFGALFTMSILIVTAIIFVIYKLIKLAIHTRKFTLKYTKVAKSKHSPKLKQMIIDLCLDKNRIIEVKESKPIAFCFGLWIPKICISTGLIKMLNKDELAAVLLHENSHLIAREPAKLFIVKFFYSIFFFLPGIWTVIHKYATFSELAADELATDNFTDRPKLARAIMKIAEKEDQIILRDGLALSFFTSTIEERVNKLADNTYMPKFRLWGRGFLYSLGAVAITAILLVVLITDSAKAFDMHSAGQCEMNSEQDQSSEQFCNLKNYQKSFSNDQYPDFKNQKCVI